MTRRILAAQLALTTALLVGLCVPMGLDATRHDRALFGLRLTAAMQAYCAEVKWRRLSAGAAPLPAAVRDSTAVPPDELRLFDPNGTPVADTGDDIPIMGWDLDRARRENVVINPNAANRHRMILVAPVSNAQGLVGILAVARSDAGLRASIIHRWTMIALAGVLVTLAALGISILLARWVGRPLRRLEQAATELGAGDLTIRARAVGGPPEARKLATTFDAMAGRLQLLVDSQRRFLADVSHQIRTPLTAMRLRLELLQQDVDADTTDEVAGTLVEVHRLSRMVDGLLAVSRAEHAPIPTQPIPLAVVAEERCLIWRPVAAAAGVTLTCDVDADQVVQCTPGHLEQILDNLLSNALEATPSGGRVSVTSGTNPPAQPRPVGAGGTAEAGLGTGSAADELDEMNVTGPQSTMTAESMTRLTVADSGRGMSAEQRAAAFRRFSSNLSADQREADQRGEVPGRADRRGNGLGLAIVHALTTADGGTVTLAEGDNGGLCVVLDLPRTHPDRRPTAARPAPAQRSVDAAGGTRIAATPGSGGTDGPGPRRTSATIHELLEVVDYVTTDYAMADDRP
ncbi:signal transduction histidine kinase [Frankia sp. CcI6]|uniref:sensor histidine kinase n=1 Tax=Frankia TaxID=1854 RepID=UPI0003CFF025|nr:MULTISPECIES: HAMP domain-containing sensor histidine kinase [Frankia]ETA02346.1 signal transduction histidine kinase [Frankia sp. CcI6]OAA24833.1 signal transduction histidine kinase [Frankia casuarinae]OHV55144.1 two-component sensor histidine kinase [Frankia sp. CgIS1]